MSILGGPQGLKDVLLEKFVGSNHKEFKIIEGELRKIISIIKSNSTLMTSSNNAYNLNNSDHNKLIERQFKQFFGLRDMKISWSVSSIANAYTYCKTYIILDKNFKEDQKGKRSNEKMFVGSVMHTGIVTTANLNEKEILAIMLHEIGHNFYNSIMHTLAMAGINIISYALGGFLDSIDNHESMFNDANTSRNSISDKFPKIYNFFNSVGQSIYNISTLIPAFYGLLLIPAALFDLINLQFFTRYSVEKHADSFATDHGYGKDLASALTKLSRPENTLASKTVYDVPGLSWMYDLFDVQLEIISGLLGSYPSNQNRIKEGLDRLKRSQHDPNIDPDVKKELANQIKEYEEFYYNYYLNLDENNNKKQIITWTYRKMVETVFKGKMDIREFIYVLDTHRNR